MSTELVFPEKYEYSPEDSELIRQLEEIQLETEDLPPGLIKKGRSKRREKILSTGFETRRLIEPMPRYAFPEIKDALSDPDTYTIGLVALSASGKSTLARKIQYAAKILFPQEQFDFIEVTGGDVRLAMLTDRGEDSTDGWGDQEWSEFNIRLESRRRLATYGAKVNPALLKRYSEVHGSPGLWPAELFHEVIAVLIDTAEGRKASEPYKNIMKILYERALFGGTDIKLKANNGLQMLVEDVNNSKHTQLFPIYPDAGNMVSALELQAIVRVYHRTPEIMLQLINQRMPNLRIHGISLERFAHLVLKSAPPTSIIGNFKGLLEEAYKVRDSLTGEDRAIFNSYFWRERPTRYINDLALQKDYRTLDAYIKWLIKDHYGCKRCQFIYNPHSKYPIYVGEDF